MRYVIAKNYLCFLALVEMIIEDTIGKSFINQEYLAEHFGITVPVGKEINIRNLKYSNKDRDWGVHINEKKLNEFFVNTGVPLRTEYIAVNIYEEEDIDDINYEYMRKDKYIIYTYSYGELYHDMETYDVGHVALLDEVISERCIKVYDPGPKGCGHKVIDRHEMYDAMRAIRGGIYVFSKI